MAAYRATPANPGRRGRLEPWAQRAPWAPRVKKVAKARKVEKANRVPRGRRDLGHDGRNRAHRRDGRDGENDALAYAHVSQEGDLSEAKNVESVTEPSSGIFCLKGINGTPHTVTATIDYDESSQLSIIRATLGRGFDKPVPPKQMSRSRRRSPSWKAAMLEEEDEAQGFWVTVN